MCGEKFNLRIFIYKVKINTMSKEIRQMIDKVKNFKQFVNESNFYIPDETVDRTGNYKYDVGDDVVFLNYDYSSKRGKIVSLEKRGMNNQLWNHYLVELDNGKTQIVDEHDILDDDTKSSRFYNPD
jgi:hypothetical protein